MLKLLPVVTLRVECIIIGVRKNRDYYLKYGYELLSFKRERDSENKQSSEFLESEFQG
jgi:hypothetical protein